MADYTFIADVSRRLLRLLRDGLVGTTHVTNETQIDLVLPSDNNDEKQLSLWLFQVTENEFIKNQPPVRLSGREEQSAPLSINLHYLVTPLSNNQLVAQDVLGRAMQILYRHAITSVISSTDPTVVDEVRIILAPRTVDDIFDIWQALDKPYRLSVCYDVRVIRIDSQRVIAVAPVAERVADFQDVEAAGPTL